jgi:hypothetical protein
MNTIIKITLICCFLLSVVDIDTICASSDIPESRQEVVDRIVALVNEEVITLTDVKIVQAFKLYSLDEASGVDYDIRDVLKKLIDQNLVIQLTRDDNPPLNDTVEEFIDGIIVEMGVEEFRRQLEHFGLTRQDLMPYAYKCIAYQRIMADRFRTSATVSLKEIEEYYEQTYIPAQEEKGLDGKPMLEILDEIEAVIKKDKSQMQVENWLKYLRERADIQINM